MIIIMILCLILSVGCFADIVTKPTVTIGTIQENYNLKLGSASTTAIREISRPGYYVDMEIPFNEKCEFIIGWKTQTETGKQEQSGYYDVNYDGNITVYNLAVKYEL